MSAENEKPSTSQLIRALSHPLRRRILRAMGSQTRSPSSVTAELDMVLPSVSYHFKVLRECNVLALEHADVEGPSIKHFYKPVIEASWAREALRSSRSEDRSQGSSQ